MLITKENYTMMHNKQIAENGDKEKNVKSSQKPKIIIIGEFLLKIIEDKRQWNNIFKMLK